MKNKTKHATGSQTNLGVHAHAPLEVNGDRGDYVYACLVITYTSSRVWSNRVRLPILLVVGRTGKLFSLSPFAPENLVSRDSFGRPVPREPVHSPHPG